MKSCSVTCLGVGDGWPCADRNHASTLYRFGKTSLLIDCGEPVDRSIKASGISYDSINAILLSHLHADHFGGLFMLMQGFWLEQRQGDLPIFMPSHGIHPLQQMFEAGLLFDELLPFKRKFFGLQPAKPFSVSDVTVTPFPTTHLNGLKTRFQTKHPHVFSAFSFLLERKRMRVGHSADLGTPEDLDPLFEKPLDLLVCEMSHFAPEQMFEYLRTRPVKQVIFVHLGSENWDDVPKLKRLGKKLLPGVRHTFARDGGTFAIE
ncbi:MAG TPA: MBL fold metallo-hydrolase [Verrucomicrobiae bacterium]|nr:MBL fold metallo-hydrolase [Verrucomicrobiae bacterium]